MAEYAPALAVLLAHEGGYCNTPGDKGGATNRGISLLRIVPHFGATAEELGIPDLTPESMKLITLETTEKFYKKHYWDHYHYGDLNDQDVATKLFDACVNFTPLAAGDWNLAHLLAQRALNMGNGTVVADGYLGPKTIDAINSCDPQWFLKNYSDVLATHYRAIVAADPSQAKFLHIWLRRAAWTHP